MQREPARMSSVCARLVRLADRDPRRVVPIARRLLANTSDENAAEWAWASFALGWTLLCWERFEEARRHLQAAHSRFVELGPRYGVLRCQQGLLLADQLQRTILTAAEKLNEIADELVACDDLRAACHTRLYSAIALNMRGQSAEAQRAFAQVEQELLPDDELNRGRLLRIRGATAIGHGEFQVAHTLLAQAERSASIQQNRQELARTWFEQGWLALSQERIEDALVQYLKAEAIFEKLDLALRIAFCTRALGFLLSRQGDYDLALSKTLDAHKYFTALGRSKDIASCDLHLGNIYFYIGNWDIALSYYNRAETLANEIAQIQDVILAQRNQAMAYLEKGSYSKAFLTSKRAELEAKHLDSKSELAEIYSLQGKILLAGNMHERSDACYTRAYNLFIALGNATAAAHCLLEQGWNALRCDEHQQAESLFLSIGNALNQYPHQRWRLDHGLACCAEARGRNEEALAYYRSANDLVAGLRRRIASEHVSSSLYTQARHLFQNGVGFAARQGDAETVLAFSESQRALVFQRMLVERLPSPQEQSGKEYIDLRQRISTLLATKTHGNGPDQGELNAALTDYGELLLRVRHSPRMAGGEPSATDRPSAPIFKLKFVRAKLNGLYSDDWTALSYTFTDEQLLLTAITSTDVIQQQIPLDDAFQRLLRHGAGQSHRDRIYVDLQYMLRPDQGRWYTPRQLANRLLPEHVRERLHPQHRLIIVPAGPLHALPWAALRLDEHWLAEQAVIQILPSLAAVQVLADRSPFRHDDVLLLGCAEFGQRAKTLPGVREEIQALAYAFGERCSMTFPATRADLFERSASGELARYGRIHIASHGTLIQQKGLVGHIKMADEDILLAEVAALHIDEALVVLSACDGAAPDVLDGEEVLSLSRAFIAAGASGVLASLWPVYDLAIVKFIVDFYLALEQHNDPALALALTQREHMHAFSDPTDRRGLPFCWGTFVMMGCF